MPAGRRFHSFGPCTAKEESYIVWCFPLHDLVSLGSLAVIPFLFRVLGLDVHIVRVFLVQNLPHSDDDVALSSVF